MKTLIFWGMAMCGRFTLFCSYHQLIEEFDVAEAFSEELYKESYNIAPGQQIVAIINDGDKNRMGFLKWGFLPSWAKDEKIASKMINARSETVDEKPSFKKSFYERRCIIPMDSFYEWKREGNSKVPMRIKRKDDAVFAVAGLWNTWRSQEGEKIHTCTILTTKANELMTPIHDRMPVILNKEQQKEWLDPHLKGREKLKSLLKPCPSEWLTAYPVSNLVNSPINNSKELIERVSL